MLEMRKKMELANDTSKVLNKHDPVYLGDFPRDLTLTEDNLMHNDKDVYKNMMLDRST